MTPTNAQNVNLLRILAAELSVNLTAVYSVIWGPFDLRFFSSLALEFTNPDVTQSIDIVIDVAPTSVGPWAESTWNGMRGIGPLLSRAAPYDKPGQLWIRLRGIADGAGVSAVTFSVSGIEQRQISGSL